MKAERQLIKEKTLHMQHLDEKAAAEGLSVGGALGADYYAMTDLLPPPAPASAGAGSSGKGNFGGPKQIYRSGKYAPSGPVVRADEVHKAADTLNLDEFLAQANAAEMRRIGGGR
jgi:hypothetical protein